MMKAKTGLTVAMCISVTLLACGGAQTAGDPKPANAPPAAEAPQGGGTEAPAESPPANGNANPNTTGAAPAK